MLAVGVAVIVASLATLPHRRDIAMRAIVSLLPQVDALYVWLDKHTDDEAIAASFWTRELLEECGPGPDTPLYLKRGDRGDGGKFYPLPHLADDDVWLILDDDLEYPADYAETMVAALKEAEKREAIHCGYMCAASAAEAIAASERGDYDIAKLWAELATGSARSAIKPPCVVGIHAMRLPRECKRYRKQRQTVQHCLRHDTRPAELTRAHVLGTSSVVTRPRYLRGFETVDVTSPPNVGDLHLAAWCERQGIPRYCLPLPREGWLTDLLPDGAPSIWSDRATRNEDAVVRGVEWGEL